MDRLLRCLGITLFRSTRGDLLRATCRAGAAASEAPLPAFDDWAGRNFGTLPTP